MKSKRYTINPDTGHLQAVWKEQPTEQEFVRIASRLPLKLLIEAAGNSNQIAAAELNRRTVQERMADQDFRPVWENIGCVLQSN
jgi:multidrug resistance efflux pump